MGRLTHCCCFTVRTGTLILAALGLATSGLRLVSYVGTAAASPGGGQDAFDRMLDGMDATFREWREEEEITEQELESLESALGHARRAWPYILAAELTCLLFCVAKHAMLLFGVLYRKRCLFLPYLIVGLGGLILTTLLASALCVLVFLYTTAAVGIAVTSACVIALAVGFYFWHVVLSHYQEIKENPDHDRLPIVIQEQPPAYEQATSDDEGRKY